MPCPGFGLQPVVPETVILPLHYPHDAVTKQGPGTEGTTEADVDFMEGAGNWKRGSSRFQHLSKGVQC